MKPFRLSRRAMLRGLGIGIGLPTLEAMLDDHGLLLGSARGAATAFPQRLVTFFIPNGVPVIQDRDHSRWQPKAEGRDYAMTPCLQPLEPFRNDINVLSGLKLGIGGPGNGHSKGGGGFATGVDITAQGATGPSIDQIAAKARGAATRLRSLTLDVNSRFTSDCGKEAVPLCYNISWAGAQQPVPADADPAKIFSKLFTSGAGVPGSAAADLVTRQRRSVIDFTLREVGRLERRLGVSDRKKLEAHLTGIRELERQLTPGAPAAGTASPTCAGVQAPAPSSTNAYSTERARLTMQLLAMAFKCNLTRDASFTLGHAGTGGGAGSRSIVPNAAEQQHECAHRGDLASLQAYTVYQVTQFAYLLSQLKGDVTTREGSGHILDNCIIYLGSEMFDGRTHRNDLQPVVLAGRAGGQVVTGRHIVYKGHAVPHMLLAMLNFVGVPTARLGNYTQPLPNLTS